LAKAIPRLSINVFYGLDDGMTTKAPTVLMVTLDHLAHGLRLDRWLREHCPMVPLSVMQKAMRTGEVRINGKRVRGDVRLQEGFVMRLPPKLASAYAAAKGGAIDGVEPTLTTEEIKFINDLVIHRDPHIVVINKPHGLATQGGAKVRQSVDRLLDGLMTADDHERPRLVHRLDQGTSGVLVLARTRQAAAALGRDLQSKRMFKLYVAVTVGVPPEPEGMIDAPLIKRQVGAKGMVVIDRKHGQEAQTMYRVLSTNPDRTRALVALMPRTGRMHQLRVHLQSLKTPILGDALYGGRKDGDGHVPIHLHAYALRVRPDHTKPQIITLRAPLPEHFNTTIDADQMYFAENHAMGLWQDARD
jgi:23S rRNA pseudouridine955/2504/2580 synthase